MFDTFEGVFWNGLALIFFTVFPAVIAWSITGSPVATVIVGFIALAVVARVVSRGKHDI